MNDRDCFLSAEWVGVLWVTDSSRSMLTLLAEYRAATLYSASFTSVEATGRMNTSTPLTVCEQATSDRPTESSWPPLCFLSAQLLFRLPLSLVSRLFTAALVFQTQLWHFLSSSKQHTHAHYRPCSVSQCWNLAWTDSFFCISVMKEAAGWWTEFEEIQFRYL